MLLLRKNDRFILQGRKIFSSEAKFSTRCQHGILKGRVYTVLSRMTLPESPEQHVGTHEMIAMGTETPAKKNVMGYVIVG